MIAKHLMSWGCFVRILVFFLSEPSCESSWTSRIVICVLSHSSFASSLARASSLVGLPGPGFGAVSVSYNNSSGVCLRFRGLGFGLVFSFSSFALSSLYIFFSCSIFLPFLGGEVVVVVVGVDGGAAGGGR